MQLELKTENARWPLSFLRLCRTGLRQRPRVRDRTRFRHRTSDNGDQPTTKRSLPRPSRRLEQLRNRDPFRLPHLSSKPAMGRHPHSPPRDQRPAIADVLQLHQQPLVRSVCIADSQLWHEAPSAAPVSSLASCTQSLRASRQQSTPLPARNPPTSTRYESLSLTELTREQDSFNENGLWYVLCPTPFGCAFRLP